MLTSLIVLGAGPKCFADSIVFSNLGTGGSVYHGGAGWFVTKALSPAFAFTPTSAVYLTQLDMALNYRSGTNSLTVDLMSDSGGPGAVLESWNASGLPAYGTCCTLQTFSGNGSILLEPGTQYWVAVLPGAGDSNGAWEYNATGDTGTLYENFGSGWVPIGALPVGAFEVQGEASTVPEPGTMILLGTGLLGLAGLLRRRSRRSAI
jgi:hypothetical protein